MDDLKTFLVRKKKQSFYRPTIMVYQYSSATDIELHSATFANRTMLPKSSVNVVLSWKIPCVPIIFNNITTCNTFNFSKFCYFFGLTRCDISCSALDTNFVPAIGVNRVSQYII